MRTALLIAEHFPPSFAVGGKRPYRFARYLPDHGWRPVVLTRAAPEGPRADPTPHPLPDAAIVDRTLVPSWVSEPKGRPSDGTRAEPTVDTPRTEPSLAQRIKSQVAVPLGPWRALQPWFQRQIRRLVEQHHPDVLYVTSSPYWLLEVGVWAQRLFGLPVCLDLRDPWSLNFNQEHKAAWVQRREARLERRFFTQAARVVLTCDRVVEAYRELYPQLPSDRIVRIYNGFDPAMRPEQVERSGQLDLVHFGNCYGPRKLDTVLRAVAALRARAVPGIERVRVVNLGRPAQTDLDLAAQLGIADAFAWEPYLPYEEGLRRLAGAHLQLLLGYGGETLYVPAKTFDYLLTGAPVLALTGSSELAGIVEATRCGFVASPTDVDATADAIAKTLAAAIHGAPVTTPDAEAVQSFSAPEITRQLAAVFEELAPATTPASSRYSG